MSFGCGTGSSGDLGDGFVLFVDGGGMSFGCGTGSSGDLGDGFVLFVDGGGMSFGCGTGSRGDLGDPSVGLVPGLPPFGCFGCFGTGDLGSPLDGLVDGGIGDLGDGFAGAAGELVELPGGGGALGEDEVAPVWLLNAAATYLMLSFINVAFLSL
jgi:hypothetical protein